MGKALPYSCGANIAMDALQIKIIDWREGNDNPQRRYFMGRSRYVSATSVQGGVRPVIVVSNNKANTYSSVITVGADIKNL